MFLSSLAIVCVILPPFLLGALGVQVSRELHMSPSVLGLSLATFHIGAGLTSALVGSWIQKVGSITALTLGLGLSGLAAGGIAIAARGPLALAGFVFVGGAANALVHPATTMWILTAGTSHEGMAFGVREASKPLVTLVAGASVPLVGLTVGWRWALAGTGLLSLVVALVVMSGHRALRNRQPSERPEIRRTATSLNRHLMPYAVAFGLGGGTAYATAIFLVPAMVDAGISESGAGLLLVMGSSFGIIARLALGYVSDRELTRNWFYMIALLAVAGLGYALLATRQAQLMAVGTVVAFSAGWGWVVLFNLGIARANPLESGRASAITQTGTFLGSATIPPLFGLLAAEFSFSAAWMFLVGTSLAAAVLLRRAVMNSSTRGREEFLESVDA